MIKPKIYLDTSVINFLFADDVPKKKEATIDFFDNYIKVGQYEAFISEFVLQEINKTENRNKRNQLLDVITKYQI